MTLEQASVEALDAARRGDLDAVQAALEARARALAAGELPTDGVHSAGELTAQLLRDLIRETAIQAARLEQIHRSTLGQPASATIDVSG